MKRLGLSLLTAVLGVASLGFQTPPAKPAPAPLPALEGVVKGPDGKPVEGALVLIRATNSQDPPDSATTDASGRFKIAARKPSTHLVRVEAKGFAAKTLERVAPGKPLDIVLQKGGVIQGTVFDGRTAEPVEGARVEARSQDSSLSLPSDPSIGIVAAVTDAKGRFRLENVAPGLHALSADARGYGRASRSAVPSGGRAELFLFPGAAIAGIVRDTEDKPVAGAIVRAETELPQRSGPPRAEVTSADGRFLLAGLDAGTHRIAVRHKDYAPAVVTDIVVRPESEAAAEVVLSAGGGIVGRLLDADSRPLKGRAALVELDGKSAARGLVDLLRAETDAEGRFRIAAAPSGSHVLSASSAGFSSTRVDVSVRDKAETDAGDIVLETGLAIRGSVRSKAGAAIPDASVSTSMPNNMPLTTQADADGSYVLSGISPGRQQLRVFAPGYAQAVKQAEAGADGVDFVLSPAGIIAGLVVNDAGQPFESFRVTARGAPPTGPNMTFSFATKSFGTSDGRFSVELGAEGPHAVEVAAPEHATAAVSNVAVVLGQTVDVGRIRLSSGGSVRGQVVDSAGAPVAGATVTVRGAGRDAFGGTAGPQGTSDVSGTFLVKGVAAGTVEVVANHPSFAEGRAAGIEVDPSKGPAEARISMTRGGRIEGYARRRDGIGLPGMTVTLWQTQPGGSSLPQVVTGEDGGFAFDHVRPGRIRAALMAGSSGRYTSVQDREVDVLEGETTSVEFVSRDILLSGRVTRGGEPAPGLRLQVFGTGFAATLMTAPPDSAAPRGPQRMMAATDADGRYEMIVNEPGKLRMNIQSGDNRTSFPMRFVEVPDVDAHVADVALGGASLQGVVVDKESGQPIADARVMAMLKKPQPGMASGGSGTSGPDGRFQIELDPEEYRVDARVQGYTPASVEVTVGASGAQEVRLALARGVALEGRVVDERGRGVGGLPVSASVPAETGENRPPPSSGFATSQPDGSFVIEGLLQQPHVVVVRSNIGSFAVHAGLSPGDRDVTLTLKPGGTLRVVVVGPEGAPVERAFVGVNRVNGARATPSGGSTDSRGTVEFPVPAGDLEIRVTREKLQGTGNASVAERGAAALEVKLTEGPPKPRLP